MARACLNLAMLTSFFGIWHNLCSDHAVCSERYTWVPTIPKIVRKSILFKSLQANPSQQVKFSNLSDLKTVAANRCKLFVDNEDVNPILILK